MTTKPTSRPLSAAELIALYPPNEEPLPDAMTQEPYITDSLYLARDHFRDRADVFMSSNTFIYYDEGNRRAHVAPDWYVSFGVDPEAIREIESYLLWIVGKAAGVRAGDRLPFDLPQRPGPEAGPVRPARSAGILAVRPERRRIVRRAAGG